MTTYKKQCVNTQGYYMPTTKQPKKSKDHLDVLIRNLSYKK